VAAGHGQMRLGGERQVLDSGQMVYIPPGVFHQLNDISPPLCSDPNPFYNHFL
jgi:mannose-6-phosphate isomerase-like protein (cupin superfamily)